MLIPVPKSGQFRPMGRVARGSRIGYYTLWGIVYQIVGTVVYYRSTLSFFVDELPIMNIHYMPLDYNGFGYYTWGKQKLVVDDVEFIQ